MKVFISWSGERSKKTAEALCSWIEELIPSAKPWMSSDIEKGTRWNEIISKELRDAKIGIVCLNKENLSSDWLLFEAGALSKTSNAHVCTFLLDVYPADIKPPLSQFQHTSFKKEDVFELINTINNKALNRKEGIEPESDFIKKAEQTWPELQKKLSKIKRTSVRTLEPAEIVNIQGITKFYNQRSEFDWNSFYKKYDSPREIIFMGQSLRNAFSEKQVTLFTRWCNNGASFRILLLSPSNSYSLQLRFVSEGMLEAPVGSVPQSILKTKIHETVGQIEEKFIKKVIGANSKKPFLRFSTVDLPFSLIMIDNEMIVTLYTTEAEADGSPTFVIEDKDSHAFKSFKDEFESIWEKHSIVSPYKDIVLKRGLQHWKDYLDLKKSYHANEVVKKPPKQAILYPTYECGNSCGFCMYTDKKGDICISKSDFQNILNQLIDYRITNIEISGGGEPLEAKHIDGILEVLKSFRTSHPEVKFGLITNGIFLEKIMEKHDLLSLFNDYIRISRLNEDDIGEKGPLYKEKYDSWLKGVKLLIQRKKKNFKYKNTKIGIKYLLSSNNKDSFVKLVQDDLNAFLYDFDHVRFRSERTMDSNEIYPIEQDIYRLLRDSEKIRAGFESKVALSLPKTNYPRNFECWISPIHVVIDPLGDTYICCNYVVDPNNVMIGNVLDSSFQEIWESKEHAQCRHNLHREICSCSKYCSNCRFAELQFNYEHIIATLGYEYTNT